MEYDKDVRSYSLSECCAKCGLSLKDLNLKINRIVKGSKHNDLSIAAIRKFIEDYLVVLNVTMSRTLFKRIVSLCVDKIIAMKHPIIEKVNETRQTVIDSISSGDVSATETQIRNVRTNLSLSKGAADLIINAFGRNIVEYYDKVNNYVSLLRKCGSGDVSYAKVWNYRFQNKLEDPASSNIKTTHSIIVNGSNFRKTLLEGFVVSLKQNDIILPNDFAEQQPKDIWRSSKKI